MKVSTKELQRILGTEDSAFSALEAIADILEFLRVEFEVISGLGFLKIGEREISFSTIEEGKDIQYYANGILISSLLEGFGQEEYENVEVNLEKVISLLKLLYKEKLKIFGLSDTHLIIVDRDENYGDIVITAQSA